MSKVDELIEELCPDGVERVALGEVAELVRGVGLLKTELVDDGYMGAIHYGQLYTRYGVYADQTYSFVTEATAEKLKKVNPGDVIVTNTSENLDDVGTAFAWLGDKQIVTGGHATIIRSGFNPKYLAYWFQSPEFYRQKMKSALGAKVIEVSAKALSGTLIPRPPVEIQEEIVRVLDQFVELDRELEREIIGREKQFQNALWSSMTGLEPTKSKRLDSIAKISTGKAVSKKLIEENPGVYPVINSGIEPLGYISEWNTDSIPIGVTSRGVNVGHVSWTDGKFYRGPLNYGIDTSVSTDAQPKFVFYSLLHHQEEIHTLCTHQGIPALNKSNLATLQLQIPPVEVQEEIATKLDTFTEYIDNLKRERELRQKQYEYYRDQLLDFPVKE